MRSGCLDAGMLGGLDAGIGLEWVVARWVEEIGGHLTRSSLRARWISQEGRSFPQIAK